MQYAAHAPAQSAPNSFTYTVMWTAPPDASEGEVVFHTAANAANGNGSTSGDNIFTRSAIAHPPPPPPPPGPAPIIGAGGIVNAASFVAAPNNTAAPGALISIFGADLATETGFAGQLPLPTDINGTRVLVNNIPAPLIFVSPVQINAQMPIALEIPVGSGANVVVQVAGRPDSAPEPILVELVSPGISDVGGGQGAVFIANTDILVAPVGSILGRESRPANSGEFISIFSTGLGQTDPPQVSGQTAAGERTLEMPTVTIGGEIAPVDFSGAAPDFVGLNQINVIVPSLPAGDHEVIIAIASRQSPTGVTVRVEGSTPPPPPMSATVEMPAIVYTPANVTIQQGGTVTWKNTDDEQHSATADDGLSFDTGIFNPGQERTVTFNTAGRFPYHCLVHGSAMTGTVTVVAK